MAGIPDRPREYWRKYYAANPEKYRRCCDSYRAKNERDPKNAALGAKLRAIRKRFCMSQKELATRLGVNKSTVHYWESGQIPVNVERIGKVWPELAEEIRRAGDEG